MVGCVHHDMFTYPTIIQQNLTNAFAKLNLMPVLQQILLSKIWNFLECISIFNEINLNGHRKRQKKCFWFYPNRPCMVSWAYPLDEHRSWILLLLGPGEGEGLREERWMRTMKERSGLQVLLPELQQIQGGSPSTLTFLNMIQYLKRNCVFATNNNFLVFISLQLDCIILCYIKLSLLNLAQITVWNMKGLRH